jgi:glycosyltransferase involved in cell wall biosynthesis
MPVKEPGIVQVTAYYPPHLGGQEVAVQELAAQLARAEERVEVVTSDLGGRRGSVLEAGVRVTRLKSWEAGHSAVTPGLLWWLIRNATRDTIVHLHFGQFFASEIVWLASKIKGFKYIFQMHCDPEASGPLGKILPLYRRLFLGRELRDAAHVIVLNEAHRRMVRERYGRRENVVTMRNGLSAEFFCTARQPDESNPMQLVFVGRLTTTKNVGSLIQALGLAKTKVTLNIVGDGECRPALEEVARAEGSDNVVFHGRQSRAEILRFYASCDAFILPSLNEAQPLSLLEAMACRIPAIATNAVSFAQLAECAVVVGPTAEGLAAGIDRLASMSASGRAEMVERAFRKAQSHEWSRVLDSYLQLYRSV